MRAGNGKGGVGMGGPGSSWKVLAGPTMLPNTSRGRLAPRVLWHCQTRLPPAFPLEVHLFFGLCFNWLAPGLEGVVILYSFLANYAPRAPRSLNIYSRRFVGVNFDVDFGPHVPQVQRASEITTWDCILLSGFVFWKMHSAAICGSRLVQHFIPMPSTLWFHSAGPSLLRSCISTWWLHLASLCAACVSRISTKINMRFIRQRCFSRTIYIPVLPGCKAM